MSLDGYRLKLAIEHLKKTGVVRSQKDVAEKMGTTPPNVSSAVNGVESVLTKSFLQRFNSAFDYVFNESWLIEGKGKMLNESSANIHNDKTAIKISTGDFSGTLVYDIDATCGTTCRDMMFTHDDIIGSVNLPGISKDSIIIRANGDSMEPKIHDGNMIVIHEIKNWDDIFYGQIYLIVLEEYRMIKYIRKYEPDEDNFIILRSENKEYDDIKLHKSKIKKLFIVENILSVRMQL